MIRKRPLIAPWLVAALVCAAIIPSRRDTAVAGPESMLANAKDVMTFLKLWDAALGRPAEFQRKLIQVRNDVEGLVTKNDRIIEQVKGMGLQFDEEVRKAFQSDTFGELLGEYGDYRIILAGGKPPVATPRLVAKAKRLDILATRISSYGPGAFPMLRAAMSMQFASHALAGTEPALLAAIAKHHSDSLGRWLDESRDHSLAAEHSRLGKKIQLVEELLQPYQVIKIGETSERVGSLVHVDDLVIVIANRGNDGMEFQRKDRPGIFVYRAGTPPYNNHYPSNENMVRYFDNLTPERIQTFLPCMQGSAREGRDINRNDVYSISMDAESKRDCLEQWVMKNKDDLEADRTDYRRQQEAMHRIGLLRYDLAAFSAKIMQVSSAPSLPSASQ